MMKIAYLLRRAIGKQRNSRRTLSLTTSAIEELSYILFILEWWKNQRRLPNRKSIPYRTVRPYGWFVRDRLIFRSLTHALSLKHRMGLMGTQSRRNQILQRLERKYARPLQFLYRRRLLAVSQSHSHAVASLLRRRVPHQSRRQNH